MLTKHKTSQMVQKARVIILSVAMRAMIERLKENGHTHVFLNTEGQPWTMNAVRLQMTRLRPVDDERRAAPDDAAPPAARAGG